MRLYSIVYKIRRIEMQQIILGSAGFLLYFIYDINSVRKQNRLLQKFFAAGTILVVLSLFMELWFAWGQCSHRIGRMIGFGIGAMCFLALLIYTLFFALPFEQTYCEENRLRAAYTEGVYAARCFVVCRCISLYVGNVWRMETGNLFFAYDFLELSVYHFSGSVDFSADVF